MVEYLNFHTVAAFLNALMMGAMAFFAFVLAPVVFKALGREDAPRLLTPLFPIYYRVMAPLAAGAALAVFYRWESKLLWVVCAGFIFADFVLRPRIEALRPARAAGDARAAKRLESVRRLYVGLQSFRSMSRMDASLMKASALRLRFSQSLASRRQRLSQAMVRSTTQRLGWTTKPFTRSDRLTISVSRSGRMPARAR